MPSCAWTANGGKSARADAGQDREMAGSRPQGLYPILFGVAAAVAGLDQLTKELALEGLADGPTDVLWGAVTLQVTYNSGGAFGVLQGIPGFFLVATVVVVAVIVVWARQLDERAWAVPLGLVLGGGVGNLIDRIFRDPGGRVVDFIDLHWWPVFNLADASIVVGVGVVLLVGVLERRPRAEV